MTAADLSGLIDIHSHRDRDDGSYRIISLDTRDFDSSLAFDRPYSLGLHPWFIEAQDGGEALRKIEAALADDRMLAVGECGLDRLTAAPMRDQEVLFRAQLQLAERAAKPVVIHCVRAFNELLRIKKNETIATPWIVHGFNNKPRIAVPLLEQGCYLSFGKALLQDGSNAREVLRLTPLHRFFLETDESDAALSEIYRAAADIKRLDPAALQAQILSNFKRVFLHD